MTREADFLQPTRDAIAGRAGYRCSFPGCDRTTIGPSADPANCENTGQAAHIFSAARYGPRGTGGLFVDQRRHANNGIWLCYTHGKLIDNKEGARYPAFELQRWKASQEARIDHEHRGLPVPFGWLMNITVHSSPLFRPDTAIEFGKVTLLLGPMAAGKTAICEWIATVCGDLGQCSRWRMRQPRSDEVQFTVKYACPNAQPCFCSINENSLYCAIDGREATDIATALRVVYLKDEHRPDGIDTLADLASQCGIHRYRLMQALPHTRGLKLPFLVSIGLEDDRENERLRDDPDFVRALARDGLRYPQDVYVRIGGHHAPIHYHGLASREVSITRISTVIGLAQLEAQHHPTVLIIDLGQNFLPDELLNVYARLLTDQRFAFQTIMVSSSERPRVDWSGWSVARFAGRAPEISVTQERILP